MASDPGELHDLGSDPAYQGIREELRRTLLAYWDPVNLERRVRQSQRDRLLIRAAETGGTDEGSAQQQWYASDSAGGPPN